MDQGQFEKNLVPEREDLVTDRFCFRQEAIGGISRIVFDSTAGCPCFEVH
jgi:hypothetical protein